MVRPPFPEIEIADGLAQGSSAAFRELYSHLGTPVLTYLTRFTGRRETAEELAQETFLTAIRKISFFKPGPDGGLKSWIFRIATHLAIDLLRRDKRVSSSTHGNPNELLNEINEIQDERESPQEGLERVEFNRSFQKALLELTDAQRMIFLMKEQEEMSLIEISRVCGFSENAVKQSLFRARTALRKKLCP